MSVQRWLIRSSPARSTIAHSGRDRGQCNCGGRAVNRTRSAIRAHKASPAAAVTNLVCATDGVDATFAKNAAIADGSRVKMQFYGTTDGNLRAFPATSFARDAGGKCAELDPRLRPWYVAGSTGPKDVVVVLDTSGSMAGDALARAIDAVINLLEGLTFSDYAMVVDYDSSTRTMRDTLLPMTRANKCKLFDWTRARVADGSTSFKAGFERAFQIMSAAKAEGATSGCAQQAIVFLTDGDGACALFFVACVALRAAQRAGMLGSGVHSMA